MTVAKRQRKKKACENGTKENLRTREPQVKQTALLASPIYIEQAQGGEETNIRKEEDKTD